MSEPLLSIRNHHAPTCGDPPIVNSDDPNVYIGYFENEHGEQWIFTGDRTTRRVELCGGDAGWTKTYAVTHDGVEAWNYHTRADLRCPSGESGRLTFIRLLGTPAKHNLRSHQHDSFLVERF
jgi:hypothetical protein